MIKEQSENSPLTPESVNYIFVAKGNEIYIRFLTPLSPDMELFIEGERSYEEKLRNLQMMQQEETLARHGMKSTDLEAHYSLPTITTPSASSPV